MPFLNSSVSEFAYTSCLGWRDVEDSLLSPIVALQDDTASQNWFINAIVIVPADLCKSALDQLLGHAHRACRAPRLASAPVES